jgi:YYY domain-containing protein
MTDALLLAFAVEAIGLLALPATAVLLRRLPGAVGYARALGLLLAAYPAWLLASLHLAPYGRATIALGVLLLATAACLAWWRGWRAPAGSARLWLATAAVFWLAFGLALALLSWSPEVWGVEKPMDMAFVNSINRADWFPPFDPWLSGSSLNYYYFGHYIVAWLVRATGADPATGYNSAVAIFFALSATGVFAVTVSLTALLDSAREIRGRALAAGIVAVGLAMLLGTLAALPELVHAGGSLVDYRWWLPSRVIAHTANDFPFYSLLIGDLHAHVMVVPFALLGLALAVQVAVFGPRLPLRRRSSREWIATLGELVLAGLVLGAVGATNSFSIPTTIALVAGAVLIWAATSRRWSAAAFWLGAWLAVSVLLFLPFLLHFDAPTNGIGFVNRHPSVGRFAGDELLLYGVFLWALAPLLAGPARRLALRLGAARALGAVAAAAVLVALGLLVGETIPVLVVIVLAIGWQGVMEKDRNATERCLCLIAALGLTVALVGNLVYVRDIFAPGLDFRFNTVFKFGYQAWYLLAVASAASIFVNAAGKRSLGLTIWLAGLLAVVAAAAVYPLAGSYSASQGFAGTPTLDGLRWLGERSPGDLAAIRWMRENIEGDPVILEAAGRDYDPRGHGRVSVFTGLPTVLAWPGHEIQWGHPPGSRADDVRAIYATGDLATARRLLRRYRVRYVFDGSLEELYYPGSARARLAKLGESVFSSRGTTVFLLPRLRGRR